MTLPPLECAGCRICCLGDTIPLTPQDNPAAFKIQRGEGGQLQLAKGKDGNCIYLGKRGCQIHGRQPVMCRTFDCRKYALAKRGQPTTPQQAASVAEGERRLLLLRRPATP